MLIGIDMVGVQASPRGERESARLGRQLVRALLTLDPANRYVLYTHEGLPTDRVPSARNAVRVPLASASGGSYRLRPTIQRVLDQNPDGLDWLVLLDPFSEMYGGLPPESPLNGLKVASVVLDLAPEFIDDRRLAPLRRHDAVLAISEPIAAEARKRMGSASWRVSTLGVACDDSFAAPDPAEPLSKVAAEELGRLGITGPFLFASVGGGPERSNLVDILDAYQLFPIEHRQRHQLAIAGKLDNPWGVVRYLHERGCSEGLVLVGEADEATLGTLYGRCAAFLSPSIEPGPGLSLVEAMRCGAPVVSGRSDIVGDAGLIVDPEDPAEMANRLSALLSDIDLEVDLRKRSRDRSAGFSWGPVIEGMLSILLKEDEPSSLRPNLRVDPAHIARPRIAVFPGVPCDDLVGQVPAEWREAYNVDLYLEPEHAALVDGLPLELGGFDVRQFDRNDAILGYHAVNYRIGDAAFLESMLERLRSRPGLVFLTDDSLLDRIGPEPVEDDEEAQAATRLRDVFLTSSRVAVRSSRHFREIKAVMPEFADQLVEPGSTSPVDQIERCAAELPRGPGRRRPRPVASPRGLVSTPHFRRTSPKADEAASPSR